MKYEIKVSKIDYYTWKVGAIVLLLLLLLLLFVMGLEQGTWGVEEREAEINDAYWHMGYVSCERYYNFTVDEMYVLNKYRIEKLNTGDENETKK
jgi:hypothetical protein